MSDDDDWFEQGIAATDESDEADDGEADDPVEAQADASEQQESAATDTPSEDDPFETDADESGPFDDGDEGPFAGGDTDDDSFGSESDDDNPFGSSDDGDPFGGESDDDPFGGGDDDEAPFGGGGGEDLFDDDGFASAFEGGGGDTEFDEEDFESEIPRIDLGIEGLDNMIQGGVPERHLMVTIGSAGTGKTTFGLQFLNHGLENGENAVYITLEQTHESIIATANEFGWNFEEFENQNQLAVVDLDPVEMANSLDNIQAELPELIRDFGADRLVLDSVSLLEMMYDNQAKRRTEVFDFTRSLKKAGVTTFLTSEASETNAYASRHGIIEYLTDAVFVLQYVRGETQETRLAVEIQKIRNANHSREKKPYEMSDSGLSVYQQANIF